jgi:hypothetical protein
MADNIVLNPGSGGATIATDDDGTAHHQYVKIEFGADNTFTKVTSTQGLPTDPLDRAARDMGKIDIAMGQAAHDAAGSAFDPVAIGGYASAATPTAVSADGDICRLWVTPNGAVNVADGGGSITVDGTVSVSGSVDTELTTADLDTGAGTDTRAVVGLVYGASGGGVLVSTTNPLPVGDNGGSLTVDGTVSISGQVDTELTTADLDTGAGTDTRAVVGLVYGASGGGVLVSTTNPLPVGDNGGSLTVDNGGTFAVQENGAALTALQKIDDPVFVDKTTFTPGTSSVSMVGFTVDDVSTDNASEGQAAAARITPDRKLIVTPQPHTAGGLSIFRSLDLDETEEDVKTSPGCVYGVWVTNTATTTRWVKFYNDTAANVVVGTTTPVITFGVPGNTSDDISGVFASTHGIQFSTAICVAATTGVADNDTGAPANNDVIINIFYK